MCFIDPAADQIESQKNDILTAVGFNSQRQIGGFIQVGGIDVDRHDFIINLLQCLDGQNDAAANREHDLHETSPAAAVRRPPAKLATIPGRDSVLIYRGL